jgi:peptide deformylase
MHDALGIGLAATQVGVMHRVLVYRVEPEARSPRSSTPCSSGRARRGAARGGLPVAARRARRGRAADPRPRARADERGDRSLVEASGLEARVLQHEMDHLDGVLILDRTTRDQRKQAMRALREAGDGSPPLSVGA